MDINNRLIIPMLLTALIPRLASGQRDFASQRAAQSAAVQSEDHKPAPPKPGEKKTRARHVFIYHEPRRFAGFPANHGIWRWGNEILVGFSAGAYKDLGPNRHAIDREKPEEHLLARSLDGGETWTIENASVQGVLVVAAGGRHGTLPPGASEPEPTDCPGGIDFTHHDFALTCRMTGT